MRNSDFNVYDAENQPYNWLLGENNDFGNFL